MDSKTLYEPFAAVNVPLRDLMDIHDDINIMRNCYVDNYIREYDRDSGASYAFNIPALALNLKNVQYKEAYFEKCEEFKETMNINPIFFYGHIGQGKTTYWKHLKDIRFKEDPIFIPFQKYRYFGYAEFTDSNSKCTDIRTDINSELNKIVFKNILPDHGLLESYNFLSKIFESKAIEYERTIKNKNDKIFQKFIINDPNYQWEGYRRGIIRWLLRNLRIKICFIIDNIDQHFAFKSPDELLSIIQDMKAQHVQAIIPLRHSNQGFQENTFFLSYSPTPLCIGLPNYSKIALKRIEYLKKFIVKDMNDPIWLDVEHTWMKASDLFKTWKSVCSLIDSNEQVKHSMGMLSNYITRDYLKIMIHMFCSKPLFYHPLTKERIDYENSSNISRGKFHALFLYALMLRNNSEHDENYPEIVIVNLFDNRSSSNWNTFIRYHVLCYLDEYSKTPMTVADFISNFSKHYRLETSAIRSCLRVFAKKGCISISNPNKIEDFSNSSDESFDRKIITISSRGSYHLELAREIEYYEILAIPQLKRRRRDLREIGETSKSERANNLNIFLNRLKQEELLLKAIVNDESNFTQRLLWTNTAYPLLEKEFNRFLGIAR